MATSRITTRMPVGLQGGGIRTDMTAPSRKDTAWSILIERAHTAAGGRRAAGGQTQISARLALICHHLVH